MMQSILGTGKLNLRLTPIVLVLVATVTGCATRRSSVGPPAAAPVRERPQQASAAPGEFTETGLASWYGAPFNGRRTSDGEIYNMDDLTAAHRTLPFNAIVRVTNLSNGRQVSVRINDRGPFVANRIIDLSYAAARAIGMIGTGTAEVRLQLVGGPDPNVGFFGVQVGAFQREQNALRLQTELNREITPVSIAEYHSARGVFYRVRAGRLRSEAAAQELAKEIESQEHTRAFVVRLDN